MAKRKNPEAVLAAAEKKRIATEMDALATTLNYWRVAAIIGWGLVLAWLWTKLKF